MNTDSNTHRLLAYPVRSVQHQACQRTKQGEAHNRIDGHQIKGEFRHVNLPQHRNEYDNGCEDNQKIADDVFSNLRTPHAVIPLYNPSLCFSTGTYCLEMTTRSPLSSSAVNRPLRDGRTLSILAIFRIVDLEARKQFLSLHSSSSSYSFCFTSYTWFSL